MKKEQIISVYNILKDADLKKMENFEDKMAVIETLRKMRPVATEYDATVETAREKLKPQGYDEAQGKLGKEGATQADLIRANALKESYSSEIGRMARRVLDEDSGVEIGIGKELFEKLAQGNPQWKGEQLLLLSDLIK